MKTRDIKNILLVILLICSYAYVSPTKIQTYTEAIPSENCIVIQLDGRVSKEICKEIGDLGKFKQISSIKVGKSAKVKFYDQKNFKGKKTLIEGNSLLAKSWIDRFQSLKVYPIRKTPKKPHTSVNPVTCGKSGAFGFAGKCLGPHSFKKYLLNLSVAKTGAVVKYGFDNFIKPLIKAIPSYNLPTGCIGDFKSSILKKDYASKKSNCDAFPLAKTEKISALTFSIMNVPCGKPVKVAMCTIFDKCGSFGISMSGGTLSCFAAATGIGAIFSSVADSIKYLQFGYSPNRMWSTNMEIPDPDNKMKLRKVNLRTHIFFGSTVKLPSTGIKVNGKDLTDYLEFNGVGKLNIDLGAKNDFSPSNLKKWIKSINGKNAFTKIQDLMKAAREFSLNVKGSINIALDKLSNNMFSPIKIDDKIDLNMLLNLGKGPDGDVGSSGTKKGFYLHIAPPPIDIVGNFVKGLFNSLKKIIKLGKIPMPIPKLPRIKSIKMSYYLGDRVGFRIQIKSFHFGCMVKFKGGFAVSCQMGLGFLSFFKEAGKWIIYKANALFDATGKYIMKFAQGVGDFGKAVAQKAKILFKNIANAAKKAYQATKTALRNAHKAVRGTAKKAAKAVKETAKKAAERAKKTIANAKKAVKEKFNKAKKKLEDAKKAVKEKFNKAKENAKKAVRAVGRKARETYEKAKRAFSDAKNKLNEGFRNARNSVNNAVNHLKNWARNIWRRWFWSSSRKRREAENQKRKIREKQKWLRWKQRDTDARKRAEEAKKSAAKRKAEQMKRDAIAEKHRQIKAAKDLEKKEEADAEAQEKKDIQAAKDGEKKDIKAAKDLEKIEIAAAKAKEKAVILAAKSMERKVAQEKARKKKEFLQALKDIQEDEEDNAAFLQMTQPDITKN